MNPSGRKLFTEHPHRAIAAVGIPGGTAVPAEEDDPVTEVAALLRWKYGTELLLHLLRFFAAGKTQPIGDSDTMGITYHTAGCFIQIT